MATRVSPWLPSFVAAAVFGALLAAPRVAFAQFSERVSFGLEGGASMHLLAPQSDQYGIGFTAGGRFGLRLVGPLALHVFGAYARWGSEVGQLPSGLLVAFGGGFRIAPEVSRSVGRFVLDADVGFSLSGADDPARGTARATVLLAGGGIGWLFPVASVLSVGPIARVYYLLNLSSATQASGDRDRSLFWMAGLSVTFHGARAPVRTPDEEVEARANERRRALDDTDHDGVADTDDRCPTAPETRNGYQDDDGCPDTLRTADDPDGDQVRAEADRCPEQPEDFDGYQDDDGCPEADNDNDGVPDTQDQCGDQPETRNGYQDDDGCPDTASGPGAFLEGGRFVLSQPVVMAGRNVADGSRAVLDAVAQQLAQHTELARVRVECRTSEGGSDRRNQRASTQCARAVVRYLRRAGVDRRRLEAVGAGSLDGAAGAATTQVQFIVAETAGAPTATTPQPTPDDAAQEGGRHHGRHRRGGHRRRRH